MWPDIVGWSATASVSAPSIMAEQRQYTTLRYFPPNHEALKQSKFCYTLPAMEGHYYLIRATFWCGPNMPYNLSTLVSGQIRFDLMVDTYKAVQIVISLPQTNPWFEEMYVPAQSGKSSVSVCLSAQSGSSDVPFINSLELRPLPDSLKAVDFIRDTNTALRTVLRDDSGTRSSDPPILRYPDDAMDRFWWRFQYLETKSTTEPVQLDKLVDQPPMAVMQTNAVDPGIYNISRASQWLLSAGRTVFSGKRYYHVALWFVELDTEVNSSGQRVFGITISNGGSLESGLDIYDRAGGLYSGYELPINTPSTGWGPYVGTNLILTFTKSPTSQYTPTLAAAEVLELFDVSMNKTTPTSPSDVRAVQDLVTSVIPGLQSFMGDPCLPLDYKYPWISCDASNPTVAAARVTSISLSNYGLQGAIPSTISLLEQLVTLDLSSNNLGGPIPDTLANLPNLKFLNLSHNNFSGPIPPKLLQKGLPVFSYEGNSFLCVTSDDTCTAPSSLSPKKNSNVGLIIGVAVGAILLFIMIIVIVRCIFVWRNSQKNDVEEIRLVQSNVVPAQPTHYKFKDSDISVNTEDVNNARINVAREFKFEDIEAATNHFSEVLGQGGFGPVYKGCLPNGLDVAVKILSHTSSQGAREFLNEVSLLSHVHHRNLVGFVGYSIEKSLVLVYEFMPHGSLQDALSRRSASRTLTWLERLQILLDAAQGLAYLHHGCNIIHRDVKSSNILLSKSLEGKISDFGISKQASVDELDSMATRVIGTQGYLDPEYASTLQLKDKVDIFSFGVVLLEALCGQPPTFKVAKPETREVHIIQWAKDAYHQGVIENIVDERLDNTYNSSSVWKVAELAMACVQHEGIKRPTMSYICSELGEAIRLESIYEISPTGVLLKYSTVEVR